MIQSEEQQCSNNSIDTLQQYANQLEQAIIQKQQSIEAQRIKFFEIIKKISFDFDVHNIEPQEIESYLKSIALIPEDFDEPLIKKKNKNNIIRIKMVQEQQPVSEVPSKQKRKYTKKQPSEEKQQQKRKRRTKKEMENARMQEQKQQ
ncbi:unnamed protein product [Paramecium octaurelia]|uniref:Uncharacterized protein n=1 Tax=Paramecium octaurelia TaxID=43137 RepID=A0A8S1TZC9_PAROT|nr:unnamed protein product [Paramecium octaurelia]